MTGFSPAPEGTRGRENEVPPTLANLAQQIVRSDSGKNGKNGSKNGHKNGSRPHMPTTTDIPAEEAAPPKPR